MADGERQVLVRQLSADVGRVQLDAKQLRENRSQASFEGS